MSFLLNKLALLFSLLLIVGLFSLTATNPIRSDVSNSQNDNNRVNQNLQTSKENEIDSSSSSIIHHRVKRQYFKPSIDGSWLTSDRITLLKNVRSASSSESDSSSTNISDDSILSSLSNPLDTDQTNTTRTTSIVTTTATTILSSSADPSFKKKIEISVTSLSLSLINLFDRVKGTLCNLIKTDCGLSNSSIK